MLMLHAVCGGCQTELYIFPPEFFEVIHSASGSVDAELQVAHQLVEMTDEAGRRFAVRDQVGIYTCPKCHRTGKHDVSAVIGQRGHAPPSSSSVRLARRRQGV